MQGLVIAILLPGCRVVIEDFPTAGHNPFQQREYTTEDNRPSVLGASKAQAQICLTTTSRATIADHIRVGFIRGGLGTGLGLPLLTVAT